MTSALFNVVVDGQLLPGFDHDTVLAQLQQQLKLPEARARQLLTGSTVTVKREIATDIAETYCKRLQALGLRARSIAAPVAALAEPPTSDTPTPKASAVEPDYLRALSTPLHTANNVAYQRALLKATAGCVKSIAAYAGLTLLAILLALYYLIAFAHLLTAPPILFSALVYLIPLAALIVLTALLLRPFLPLQTPPANAIDIDRRAQPRLFALIDKLCAALAVPAPTAITLSTHTGITVASLPGLKNFWHGNYRLTLGLPLFAASNTAQFIGLLAGQLRTTATRTGLRYGGLLQYSRARLQGCLDGADWLQQRIDDLQSRHDRFAALRNATQLLFAQSNRLLQNYLKRIETTHQHFIRALLGEQDRYFALLAGSAALPELLLIEAKLDSAANDAIAINTEDRVDGGLVDNLPALIEHYYDSLDEKFAQDTQRHWNNETLSRKDAAPIVRERIEQVTAQSGIFESAEPARALLDRFSETALAATQQSYRAAGYIFDAAQLLPVDTLTYAATQDILQRQQSALYFNNWFKPFRFWSLANYQLIREMPLQDAAQQLSVCVNEIRRLSPDRFKLLAEYERLQNQIQEILLAQHVLAAGKTFAFRYISYDGTTLQPLLEDRQQQLTALMEKLTLQEAVMGGRITLGLRLCGQAENEVVDLYDALRLINDCGPRLYKLALDVYQFEQLLQLKRDADFDLPIRRLEERLRDASAVLLARLGNIPCPLDTRHQSLKSYVEAALQQPFIGSSKSPVLQNTRRLLDTLYRVNEKLSLLAADYGTIAEEAYRIEPIKLVATAG